MSALSAWSVSWTTRAMSSSGRKNQVSASCQSLNHVSVYILKENGERVVNNLEQLSRRAQILLQQGNALRYEVKSRKIEVMTQIDDNFEKIIRQILRKKAEIKLKYVEALQVEEARIVRE